MHGLSIRGNLPRIPCTHFGIEEQGVSHCASAAWQAATLLHITNKARKVSGESLFQDKFEQKCKHRLKLTHSYVTSTIWRDCTLSECDGELMRNKGLSPPIPAVGVGKNSLGRL